MQKELKVIENELVSVYETSTGEKVVYGTELHETLEVKSKFADWVKNRLFDCEAQENKDFEMLSKNLENGGRIKEYIIKLDIAKEMAMLERNERGKQVRRYFIKIEKKYKEKETKKTITEEKQAELEIKKMRAEAMQINAKTRAFKELKETLPKEKLSNVAMEVFGIKFLEDATGKNMGSQLPQVEMTYSASEVGARFGISANMIGRIAKKHDLKTKEYGIVVMDKSAYSSKEMPTFRYNDKAIEKFKEILKQQTA